jgi:hypothetical protein
LGPDGLHTVWLHGFRKTETAKPVIKIVSQHANLQFNRIGLKMSAAHFLASKAILCFFNKILHSTAVAVDANDGLGCQFKVCNDIGEVE